MKKNIYVIALTSLFSLPIFTFAQTTTEKWVAPKEEAKKQNPFKGSDYAIEEGRTLFTTYCTACHGEKGDGKGPGAVALKPQPVAFSNPEVQKQTDGALFWKMTTGRNAMASYKNILTEDQRWYLVSYLRTFAAKKK